MEKNKLIKILDNFRGKKIGVIGDLMLDHFIWGGIKRISPEAPVPVILVERESFVPGGAANTANNIIALGGGAHLVGIIGSDEPGNRLKTELKKRKIGSIGIFSDCNRPTTQKTRLIVKNQQIARIDREEVRPVSQRQEKKALDYVKSQLKNWDGLVFSDYNKGFITKNLAQKIISLAKNQKKPIIADIKPVNAGYFRNVTILNPNKKEATIMTGENKIMKAGKIIQKKFNCSVLIKQGVQGMTLFENNKTKHFTATAKKVFDVVGAGDTVAAVLALALVSGANLSQAAEIANRAAGIVVGKAGTAVVLPEELKKELQV